MAKKQFILGESVGLERLFDSQDVKIKGNSFLLFTEHPDTFSQEINVVRKPMILSAPKTSGNVNSVTPDNQDIEYNNKQIQKFYDKYSFNWKNKYIKFGESGFEN